MKRNKDFERWLFNEAMIEVKQEVKLNEMVKDIFSQLYGRFYEV